MDLRVKSYYYYKVQRTDFDLSHKKSSYISLHCVSTPPYKQWDEQQRYNQNTHLFPHGLCQDLENSLDVQLFRAHLQIENKLKK
jgi:hypothetical protein